MSLFNDSEITMIAAAGRNNVIGADGKMPFTMKSDMKHFRASTMGKPVVMGRKTWEALPKPLEGRRNIVMTHDTRLTVEGGETVNDIEQALAICEDAEEIMVIGGGEIYRLWLPRADRILLSRIDAELEGDTTFPPLDPVEWHCISIETHMPKEGDDYPWTLLEMVRHYEGL